jgi:glycosyltransferase involved in cell wall biosynthesis
MKLSICIPTFNRSIYLSNCINSISANKGVDTDFQVCISDNCSTDKTEKVIRDSVTQIPIKYSRNKTNLGLAKNILKAVDMADGEFVWLIGDDDLLMPNALSEVLALLNGHQDVDFFYVNSSHLHADYVFSFPHPFCLHNLPAKMIPFSKNRRSGLVPFFDLIDPRISFDFLGGIFLSIFRRSKWVSSTYIIDETAMSDERMFSHFDNTFPHMKIFAHAFANSSAYFHAKPLSICVTGAREWSRMYPLVRSVRLIEGLGEYRKNGLSRFKYFYCKNAALKSFATDFMKMIIDRERSGFLYVSPIKLVASNLAYPNFYLSFMLPMFRSSFWRKAAKYMIACMASTRKARIDKGLPRA